MSASVSPLEALRADPEWSALYDRIEAALLHGGLEVRDDPGECLWKAGGGVLERYARAVTEASDPEVSLAVTLPMTLVAGSLMGQGAFWARTRIGGGGWLQVPSIVQATLIAPSGYGKSSSLDPLTEMVDRINVRGIAGRRAVAAEYAQREIDNSGATDAEAVLIQEKWRAAGTCGSLTIDSGNPEGVRTFLTKMGSVGGIMTSEPDVLREISAYSKDGGTFRYFLDGWGGSKIDTVRASGQILVPRAVLPYCIMVQPGSFDQYNAARIAKDGGSDAAIARGVYGRSWLVRVEGRGGAAVAFGMRGELAELGVGEMTPLMGAEIDLENALERLARASDVYRAGMAASILERDNPLPERIWLELEKGAMPDYMQMQNLRSVFASVLAETAAVNPEFGRMFDPVVSRLTQHALRFALVCALAEDASAREIPADIFRDCCLRLLPWLVEHLASELSRYTREVAVMQLEEEIKSNPQMISKTPAARMDLALSKFIAGRGGGPGVVFTNYAITKAVRDSLPSNVRNGPIQGELQAVWDKWLQAGLVAAVEGTGGGGRAGAVKFIRTPLGAAHIGNQARVS